jgi:hypothetical protein
VSEASDGGEPAISECGASACARKKNWFSPYA